MTESNAADRRWLVLAPAPLALAVVTAIALTGCKTTESAATTNAAAPASATAPAHVANPIDPMLAIATFDSAWELVYESHFDPNFNGVDWSAVRDELRPRVEGVEDENELRAVIADMLSRLGQSHFALLPREAVDRLENDAPQDDSSHDAPSASAHDHHDADRDAPAHADHHAAGHDNDDVHHAAHDDDEVNTDSEHEGDLGLNIALIDNEVVVTSVEEGSPAAYGGIRSGWVIDEINGRNLAERLRDIAAMGDDKMASYHAMQLILHRLGGNPGSIVELALRDEHDNPVELELERRVKPGELIQFGNLPPMNANLEHERLIADSGTQVGVIRFSIWMLPLNIPFAHAIDDLRDADGMVIDLRGNPGGVGAMSMGIAGYFVNNDDSLGTMKMRASEINFNVKPRRFDTKGDLVDPFAGPVAILMDRYSASTSEIFAAGMQAMGRAHVFGETSAGAALPAQMNRLPNGDVLLHAFADFILPTGESVEGTGVIPDTPIVLTRKDLIGGKDPVLDAAVAWIASQTGKASAAAVIAK